MQVSLITELKRRGVVHDITPGSEGQLQKEATGVYMGIDLTAPSLHIGNLAALTLLKRFQLAGHRPYLILGGGTSRIGDPSFKQKERKLLDRERLQHYQEAIQKQVTTFFEGEKGNEVVVLNNDDWLGKLGCIDFLREAGKHISVNYLLAKEAIKKRQETGISYTEFAYPLMQAYDFAHLYRDHGVRLQIGGADQWGNIITGIELIRRKGLGEAFGMTMPLLTRGDGTKFGKTAEGENVWLSREMTSPYQFYQFWLNSGDEEAYDCLCRMTFCPLSTIDGWRELHQEAPDKRLLQRMLAKEMTCMVHGGEEYAGVWWR